LLHQLARSDIERFDSGVLSFFSRIKGVKFLPNFRNISQFLLPRIAAQFLHLMP
jgi:hypothetical protein